MKYFLNNKGSIFFYKHLLMRNKQKGEDGKPAKSINSSLQTQCYKICVRIVVLAVVDLLKSDHRRIN